MSLPVPNDILIRVEARKRAHPDKIVWVLFADDHWYVFAHTKRVAIRRIEKRISEGHVVFSPANLLEGKTS